MRRFIATLALCLAVAPALATTKLGEFKDHSPTLKAWFTLAQPMPEARKKNGWPQWGCCDMAERVHVKFSPLSRDADEWRFKCPTEEEDEFAWKYCLEIGKRVGDWVTIPPEIIHQDRPEPPKGYGDENDPKIHAEFEQLRHEGVLFIANVGGNLKLMCFWPPEDGG